MSSEEEIKFVDEVSKAAFGILLTKAVAVNKLEPEFINACAATAFICGRVMLAERDKMVIETNRTKGLFNS